MHSHQSAMEIKPLNALRTAGVGSLLQEYNRRLLLVVTDLEPRSGQLFGPVLPTQPPLSAEKSMSVSLT